VGSSLPTAQRLIGNKTSTRLFTQKTGHYRPKETIPLPGGETAVYNSTGLEFIRHTDWLGSSRLATTWAHAVYSKEAYAPFGETYNEAGTPDRSFTGQDQDMVTGSTGTGIYDFLFRKYDPSAGRWLSPDPAGWGVVSPTDPRSLNRYAYVENSPMSAIDPSGLDCMYISDDGTSIEAIDSSSSVNECAGSGGTWIDGHIDIANTSYNPQTGLFTILSINNGTYINASFQSGAQFGATGGIGGSTTCWGECGGASIIEGDLDPGGIPSGFGTTTQVQVTPSGPNSLTNNPAFTAPPGVCQAIIGGQTVSQMNSVVSTANQNITNGWTSGATGTLGKVGIVFAATGRWQGAAAVGTAYLASEAWTILQQVPPVVSGIYDAGKQGVQDAKGCGGGGS
jgi:RHS repeat-associated protein